MNIRQILFLFSLVLATTGLSGQGLVFDDQAYEKLPRQSLFGDGSKSENKALDNIFKIDLKPYCPKIMYQGTMGSCVGWSVGYGAFTIQQAIKNDWKDQKEKISKNAFSALFIYNQIKLTDCNFGARIEDALELLKIQGDVPAVIFDEESDCYKEPTPEEISLASQNKIIDYLTLFSPDDSDKIKINKTKLSLIQNRPVVIGMELRKNFYNIRRGEEFWYPEVGNTNPGGGHAMVVVGYDEGKKAFEIMNSWGELWGNEGFIWVKYEDFAKYCKYAFQFTTKNPIGETELRYANLNFRRPVIRTNDTIIFSQEPLIFQESFYELEKGKWDKGSIFQLVINNVSEGTYLYAFSYDADGEIKIHWPRDEKLDHKYEGMHESALITVPEVELVIPGQNSALQINKSGTEHICLLFLSKPITGFNKKIKKVKSKKGSFLKKIKSAFKNEILAFDQVSYEANDARFFYQMESNKIIPLILKIEVE